MGGAADSHNLENLQSLVSEYVTDSAEFSDEQAGSEAVIARGLDILLRRIVLQSAELHAQLPAAGEADASHSSAMLMLEEDDDPSHSVLLPPAMSRHEQNVNLNAVDRVPDGSDGISGSVLGPDNSVEGLANPQPMFNSVSASESRLVDFDVDSGTAALPLQSSSSSSAAGSVIGAVPREPGFEQVLRELLTNLPSLAQARVVFSYANEDASPRSSNGAPEIGPAGGQNDQEPPAEVDAAPIAAEARDWQAAPAVAPHRPLNNEDYDERGGARAA